MAKAPAAKTTEACTFYDARNAIVVEVKVKVDTSLGARMVAVRNAAGDYAADHGHTLFAIPALVLRLAGAGDEKWLTFRMQGRMAQFLKAWPNRASAEMWMQHNGST